MTNLSQSKFNWILIFVVASAQSLNGQNADQSYPKLSQSSIFQWTGENGLVSNNITSVIQAKSGFIWMTTYNGIMRFDGIKVDVFDRSTLPFLATDAFYRVYEDSKGILWFASQGSGIIQYDGQKFSTLKVENGPVPKSSRCLLLEDSVTWIGSNNEGLLRISKNKIETVTHPLLKNITVLSLARDSQYLWIATDGVGLIRYDGTSCVKFTENDGLHSNTVNAVGISPNGVYVGTNEGLNVIKGNKILSEDFLKNIHITDITSDWSNRIWIAADNGLARIDPSANIIEFEGEKNGYPFNRINSVIADKEGSIWLGTGRNGLIQLREPNIINLTTYQGLSLNRCNIIYESRENEFYIGSDGGHVDVYRNGKLKNIPIVTQLNEASIRDICVDNDGAIWIGSYKGALVMNKGTEKLLTEKDGLPANDIRRILKAIDGSIWVGTRSGGIADYKNGIFTSHFNKKNGLESDYVLALEQDEEGALYVGTHSGGLTVIKADKTFKTFHLTDNDAGVLIFNIHIQSPTKVFLVSNIGLYFFDGQKFKLIETNRNHRGETHFDWVEDRNGDVWISGNIGLLKIKKTDLDLYLKDKIKKVPVRLFDNQDGMKNKECTGATRMLVSSTEKVWVPTIGGATIIYPENIKENKIPPAIYVTNLQTDKDTITQSKAIISPGNLRYIFNYTGLSFKAPSKVLFKYKLEGLNEEWKDAGSRRTVEYTNLSPGKYTFYVTGSNNDDTWNNDGATFQFTVLPYFYQTSLFYTSIMALFLMFVYGIYKWRLRTVVKSNSELKKLNEELDNFVYSTSHDLRAPLTSIMGLINLFRLEKENKEEYINLIEKSIKKMDAFISEITDFSRNARLSIEPTKIDFRELIADTVEHLQFLDISNGIEKVITIDENLTFYSDKLRLGIILNNLITNAIKYSNYQRTNPRIEIKVFQEPNGVMIKVSDNGIGIRADRLNNIFDMFYRGSEQSQGSGLGLYIVKETVQKLKGEIKVQSTLGEGASFEVRLPSLENV